MPSDLSTSDAARMLRSHGIRCRRDWGNAGRWLAEHGMTQYCVGSNDLVAAATAADPLTVLDARCA